MVKASSSMSMGAVLFPFIIIAYCNKANVILVSLGLLFVCIMDSLLKFDPLFNMITANLKLTLAAS